MQLNHQMPTCIPFSIIYFYYFYRFLNLHDVPVSHSHHATHPTPNQHRGQQQNLKPQGLPQHELKSSQE